MKKFLSIILALALIIGLVPSVFADGTAQEYSGITVEYDFTSFEGADVDVDTQYVTSYDTSYGFWMFSTWGKDGRTAKLQRDTDSVTKESMLHVEFAPGNSIDNDEGETATRNKKDFYIAYEIYVPKAGNYNITLENMQWGKGGADAQVFVFSASESFTYTTLTEEWELETKEHCQGGEFSYCNEDISKNYYISKSEDLGNKYFDKGNYTIVFAATQAQAGTGVAAASYYMAPIKLILDGTQGDNENYVPMISSLTSGTDEETGVTTVTATAAKMSNGDDATSVTYSYAVAADDVALAEVDATTGVVTGLANGTATIIATATKNSLSSSKSIEVDVTAPAPEKTDLEIAFELDDKNDNYTYIAPSVTGLDITGDVITPVDNENGTYTLEAPEADEDGNPFLYWAKGLDTKKRIISFDRIIKDYVPTEDGKNYLIAVYEGDVSADTAEYYNQNGQRIAIGAVGGEKPALPSMAGYGAADEWVQCGTTNIWVAKYGEKTQPDNVTVTVNGEERTVPYGKDVPCEATGDNFKCWTKQGENEETDEIVSVDKNYTFKAWENCTVTAVYADHTKLSSPMKIFIDSFTAGSETGIMAEFIGITGAVEKGIMWNDVKIPMTNPGNQFSVIADKNGTYKGYAILENGTGYTLITDGAITISNKAE